MPGPLIGIAPTATAVAASAAVRPAALRSSSAHVRGQQSHRDRGKGRVDAPSLLRADGGSHQCADDGAGVPEQPQRDTHEPEHSSRVSTLGLSESHGGVAVEHEVSRPEPCQRPGGYQPANYWPVQGIAGGHQHARPDSSRACAAVADHSHRRELGRPVEHQRRHRHDLGQVEARGVRRHAEGKAEHPGCDAHHQALSSRENCIDETLTRGLSAMAGLAPRRSFISMSRLGPANIEGVVEIAEQHHCWPYR